MQLQTACGVSWLNSWTTFLNLFFLLELEISLFMCRKLLLLSPRRLCDNRSLPKDFDHKATYCQGASIIKQLAKLVPINQTIANEPTACWRWWPTSYSHILFSPSLSAWDWLISLSVTSQPLIGPDNFWSEGNTLKTQKLGPRDQPRSPLGYQGNLGVPNLLRSSLFLSIMYEGITTFPLKGF